ncbi:SIR2 family protein [Enhygromyxa salina]|nr:SIR2 family protein [Enhygromyxa salina]
MRTSIDLDQLRALATPLVIYVGHELPGAAGLPTRRELTRLLLDALPEQTSAQRRRELAELSSRGDLGDAFTEFERDLTRARFCMVVERALCDDGFEPPALARVLAGLGPRVKGIVTPNLDRLLERAFASRLVTHVRPSMGLVQRANWLLKTHGTLPDRSTWVFTREQHAQVAWRDPIHAKVLSSLFIATPMLFVATTLDDPIFSAIVDQTRGLSEGAPPRHWALLRTAALSSAGRSKLDEAGISAITCDSDDEILRVLASLAPDPSAVPSLPARTDGRRPTDRLVRILFVSANPQDLDSLAVDREQRVIQAAIARASRRDEIVLETRAAASFADLSRALLEQQYDVVHIAGHGEGLGIILDDGGRKLVPPAQLAALFNEYAHPRGRLRCVVLNSCFSSAAGRVPTAVPVLVTMHGPLDDRAALAFSEGFYDAIGAGHDFAAAFREADRRARTSTPGGLFDAVLFEHEGTS